MQLRRLDNLQSLPEVSLDSLKLKAATTGDSLNFHTGFFTNNNETDSKYFLLANLMTTNGDRQVEVTVANNSYNNIRFRNIEANYNFDMTFTGQTTQSFNFPAGEGYLFQVAPVVKYGGKLVYSESVGNDITL